MQIKSKQTLLNVAVFLSISSLTFASPIQSTITLIPKSIQKQMQGTTMHKGCPVGFNHLRLVQVPYWGFDNKTHQGELIVNQLIAKSTLKTFSELYKIKFPIDTMILRNYFYRHPNDQRSHDNTAAFNCRKDGQSPKKMSLHSYGIAVDINSFYNPSVIPGGKTDPAHDQKYLNRSLHHKGMIHTGSPMFHIMTENGWAWGKYFRAGADYQHFEKIVTRNYVIKSLSYRPNTLGINDAL